MLPFYSVRMLVLLRLLVGVYPLLKLLDTLAQAAAQLWQALGAKEQSDDQEQNY